MTTSTQPNSGLDLPAFLVVTPDEQERRNEYNRNHPIVPDTFIPTREVSPEEQAVLDELEVVRRADEKNKRDNRAQRKETIAAQDRAISDGKVWRNGRWVVPDLIGKAHAARIMRDLPTDSMRAIFVKDYAHRVVGGIKMPKGKK